MRQLLNRKYSITFWLAGILWASGFFLFSGLICLGDTEDAPTLEQPFRIFIVLFETILVAVVFSLPILILVHLAFVKLSYTNLSPLIIKLILCFIAIIGIFLTCIFIDVDFFEDTLNLLIPFSYLAGFSVATFHCKIKKGET
jgi:hypothetical protein